MALQSYPLGSDGEFLDPSWRGIECQHVINAAQGRFGDRGLADMQGATVALLDISQFFLPVRFGQTGGQRGKTGLEPADEPSGDRGLLALASPRAAV